MAIDNEGGAHRPGIWKQQNKTHKCGRHRSKSEIDNSNKGKANVKTVSRKNKQNMQRVDRRNQAQQLRSKKREETLAQKRGLGTMGAPPFLIAIIPLCTTQDPLTVLEALKMCDETAVITTSQRGYTHISIPRFKQRFCFFVPHVGDLHSALDAAKVADTLMLLYDMEEDIDGYCEKLLTALFTQGLPSTLHVVQGINKVASKKRSEIRRNLQKIVENRFPNEKVMPLDTSQDAILLLRQVGNQKQRQVTYRNRRAHLLGESLCFEPLAEQWSVGTLKVSGYLRGRSLSVNGLVHIPGWGDYQMTKIEAPPDPHPLSLQNKNNHKRKNEKFVDHMDLEVQTKLLGVADPLKQQSLQFEHVPDPMDGEQTWPTEEELHEAKAAHMATKKGVKKVPDFMDGEPSEGELHDSEAHFATKKSLKVPKGISAYQAAWIVDSGNEESDDNDDDSENEVDMEDPMEVKSTLDSEHEGESNEEYETMTETDMGDDEKYDDKIDVDEEEKALLKFKAARMDALFPDEIDTPMDVSAEVRFQKYRGLKSFRTSPWDHTESLPYDYARIFRFENFARTKKRVLAEEGGDAQVGCYITIHVADVPKQLFDAHHEKSPLVIYGLLSHEHKISVLNMAIKRLPNMDAIESEPIKSKEKLIFHVGFRRFTACPIFSQHTNGDKHKYERYLQSDVPTVATVFAPIVFPPCSVLVFKEQVDGSQTFVATGSVQSINPNRIVVKRVVLSGHPFKINRKAVVVRYMFFTSSDINYYKPVELRTKYGRRGHIKEPLGTHGHMKCIFDGQLTSQDVILMNLYKRVFPKWTYDPHVPEPPLLHFIDSTRTPKVRFATDSSAEEDTEMHIA